MMILPPFLNLNSSRILTFLSYLMTLSNIISIGSALEKRKVFSNWLKRSRHYIPIIREILKDQGMPEDLVYVAMIESGFNPKAYSHAKASGPWQFIYATGGRYGLKVNYWIDERRDLKNRQWPQQSTYGTSLINLDVGFCCRI